MDWVRVIWGVGWASVAVGLPTSHSLISLGVGIIGLLGLAYPYFRQQLCSTLKEWLPLASPFWLLYLLHGLSWIYTEDKAQWLVEMRIKLPMLFLLPWAHVGWRLLSARERAAIQGLFQLSVGAVGLIAVGKVLQNPTWALHELREGRAIPLSTGISHIYYGGLVGMALLWLWFWPEIGPRWLKVGWTILHLVILHTLALRTALLGIYGAAGVLWLYWLLGRKRQWGWAIGGLVTGISAGVLLVRFFPPLHQRWQHFREDIARYAPGANVTHTSVTRRLIALEASWQVFRKAPWWGVGMADNSKEVFEATATLPYFWEFPNYVLPHNQFVEYAVGLGLIGLSVFLSFWVLAARQGLTWQGLGWLVYWFLLMQVEAFLERQVGITAFLWGTGMVWSRRSAHMS
ncbi:MAG: O-antigen ligase family protein [Bacteroidia bacterium]|nr:O-antigen ligase family protein [Bacteroidia bacterium]MDW8089332.1 O-antigen ligase family protein [Bacteroidia bacterium]